MVGVLDWNGCSHPGLAYRPDPLYRPAEGATWGALYRLALRFRDPIAALRVGAGENDWRERKLYATLDEISRNRPQFQKRKAE